MSWFGRRSARRGFKDLEKVKDPVLKIRYIYRIFIDSLLGKSICIEKSDTAREIHAKTCDIAEIEKNAEVLTSIYEKTRYSEKIPGSTELLSAEDSCRKICDSLKHTTM
jgi:hypothetical protein